MSRSGYVILAHRQDVPLQVRPPVPTIKIYVALNVEGISICGHASHPYYVIGCLAAIGYLANLRVLKLRQWFINQLKSSEISAWIDAKSTTNGCRGRGHDRTVLKNLNSENFSNIVGRGLPKILGLHECTKSLPGLEIIKCYAGDTQVGSQLSFRAQLVLAVGHCREDKAADDPCNSQSSGDCLQPRWPKHESSALAHGLLSTKILSFVLPDLCVLRCLQRGHPLFKQCKRSGHIGCGFGTSRTDKSEHHDQYGYVAQLLHAGAVRHVVAFVQ